MELKEWIAQMTLAMNTRDYQKIRELCAESDYTNEPCKCSNSCPFNDICDWMSGVLREIPSDVV